MFHQFSLNEDDTALLGLPQPWQIRGWCMRADRIICPRGKTLLTSYGTLRIPRSVFHKSMSKDILTMLVASGLTVDIRRIPWGCFWGEIPTGDREKDFELLADLLEGFE